MTKQPDRKTDRLAANALAAILAMRVDYNTPWLAAVFFSSQRYEWSYHWYWRLLIDVHCVAVGDSKHDELADIYAASLDGKQQLVSQLLFALSMK